MNYKIDKGIPLPDRGTVSKYPFAEMEVGDSFVVSDNEQTSIISAANSFGKKFDPRRKFVSRKITDTSGKYNHTIRIWRVA
jgi:hypothetical protein